MSPLTDEVNDEAVKDESAEAAEESQESAPEEPADDTVGAETEE